MHIEKKKLMDIKDVYVAETLILGNTRYYAVASEMKGEGAFLINSETLNVTPFWTDESGVMNIIQLPFSDNVLCIDKFYPVFQKRFFNAVPRGQVEAAMSLGMRPARIMFKIVLPQAIRYVIPSLISQLVVVVKDTTVAYVVSYPDLMQNARVLITNYDALVSMYFTIAIIYILLNFAINKLSALVADRLGVKIIR